MNQKRNKRKDRRKSREKIVINERGEIWMLKILEKIKKYLFGLSRGEGHFLDMNGSLYIKLLKRDGEIIDKGLVATKMVTNAGAGFLVDAMQSTAAATNMGMFYWHGCSIGTGAEAVGDTALSTGFTEARTTGTQTETSAMVYKTVSTHTFSVTGAAITEHGLFSSSASTTLWDRSLFAVINVSSGDSVEFTYELTVSPGG